MEVKIETVNVSVGDSAIPLLFEATNAYTLADDITKSLKRYKASCSPKHGTDEEFQAGKAR